MASQNWPFTGPTVTNDLGVNEANPGIQFGGTENGAIYFEEREVAGTLYRVQNATWNAFASKWLLVNTALPAYAVALTSAGVTQFLTSPANTSPFTTWTIAWAIDKSGNAALGTLTLPANSIAGSAIQNGSITAAQLANGSVTGAQRTDLIFNVLDYGAKGNGVNDDTAGINAAIGLASIAGGTVYFPQGTYLVSSQITISSSLIVLRGEGKGSGVIKAAIGFGTNSIIRFQGTTGAHLAHNGVFDLTFDATNLSAPKADFIAAVYAANCDYFHVERCQFLNSPAYGTFITNDSNSLATPILHPVVVDCEYYGCGNGISQFVGLSQTAVSPGSVTVTLDRSLPSGVATGLAQAFIIDANTVNEEEVFPTAYNVASHTFTATFAKSHSVGAQVTGIRSDSAGGGAGILGSVYERNIFDHCYGNAIDNTLTDGGNWVNNISRNAQSNPSGTTWIAGSIAVDFGLTNTAIVGNHFTNAGGVVVMDNGGASSNNVVAYNRIISGGQVQFYSFNSASVYQKNIGNRIVGNVVEGSRYPSGIALYDQLSAVVALNEVRNCTYSGGNATLLALFANANASSKTTLIAQGNTFVDDVLTAGTSTYSIYENQAAITGLYSGNLFAATAGSNSTIHLGSTTPTSILRSNPGYNPALGAVTTPSISSYGSGVAIPNNTGVDVTAYISGGSVSAIAIQNTSGSVLSTTGLTSGMFRIPAGASIKIVYATTPPSMIWVGD
jgi:hypothetical protein